MKTLKTPNSKQKPMYCEEFKREFISFKDNTIVASAEALFRRSYVFEESLGRDLFTFSLTEVEEIFKASKSRKANNDYNVLKSYLEFSIEKGMIQKYVLEGTNLKYFENLLVTDRRRIKEEILNQYITACYNDQDKIILRLLFEGVNGQGQSELLNLKNSDIDRSTNTIQLYCDKNGHRPLTVSDECIRLIDLALKQNAFYLENGEVSKGRIYDYYCKNDYVIRSLRRKVNDENKRTDKSFLISRFQSFKKWFNEPDLSPTVINKSGMLSYAIKLSKQNGIHVSRFKHDVHWRLVAEKFPMKGRYINGAFQYESLYRDIDLDEIDVLYGNYLGNNFVLQSDEEFDKDIFEKKKRDSAPRFRRMILNIYNGKCAITGEDTIEALEACHIQDYKNDNSNHHQNGILLRADFHKLYDLGLVQIDENYVVSISKNVTSDFYRKFNGMRISLPKDKENYPSKEALKDHNEKR